MRKRILGPRAPEPPSPSGGWLELERVAEVELTSEDEAHPIESALGRDEGPGWRAAEAGEQVIRLHLHPPQHLRRIRLEFHEPGAARTQEFVLRWSAEGEPSYRPLLRQQYNFSPHGATREVEDYAVDLHRVAALELRIVPDVSGGEHHASLARWRLAAAEE